MHLLKPKHRWRTKKEAWKERILDASDARHAEKQIIIYTSEMKKKVDSMEKPSTGLQEMVQRFKA